MYTAKSKQMQKKKNSFNEFKENFWNEMNEKWKWTFYKNITSKNVLSSSNKIEWMKDSSRHVKEWKRQEFGTLMRNIMVNYGKTMLW